MAVQHQSAPTESEFVDLAEASRLAGNTPVPTLREWISKGRLAAYKPGRRVLLKRLEVLALVERARVGATH